MEFGLVSICIGPCPIVFWGQFISVTGITMALMICARRISSQIQKLPFSKFRIFLTIFFLALSGLASILATQILFSLILNLIGGGGICTHFVEVTGLEKIIPLSGTLLCLTRKPNRRILKFLHAASLLLFLSGISVSFYEGILWNLILYDAPWGSNSGLSFHEDYQAYLEYENRINYFSIAVVIYFSLLFSYLLNRLYRFLKPGFPIVRGVLFTAGLLISWMMSGIFYTETYHTLVCLGIGWGFICIMPGLLICVISPIIFLLTWVFMNRKASFYEFSKRLGKIGVVKKKTKFSLEQIKIASPCPASWEEMIGDDAVRFCQICSKNVYNLSLMSKAEAQTLVMNNQGKLCGLLYLRKDGSVMTSDCPVGFGEIRRRVVKNIAKVAGATFAFIGLQQFFVNGWNEELVPVKQDKFMRETISIQHEQVEEVIMGAIGYIEE